MFLIELLKSFVFGVVEGISEWLPISSTGHLLLLQDFMPLQVSAEFWDMFLVVIQLGAILAVPIYFFHDLNPFSPKKDAGEKHATWSLWAKTIVACIPAAVIGIPLDDWIEAHFSTPLVIAATLIIYGIIFIVIEGARKARAKAFAETHPQALERAQTGGAHFAKAAVAPLTLDEVADLDARVKTVEALDWKTALGIGLFQVLSIVPGTSRSGSTIIGGLLLGCSRAAVAQFTFYLAIPVMFGASALRLVKFFIKGGSFVASELLILAVACVSAFVVSLMVIRFLMGFVKKHNFAPFGWYRIVLGIVIIAYSFLV